MKNILILSLFSLLLSACNGGGGGSSGGGGGAPTPPVVVNCTDLNASNRGQPVPCQCNPDFVLTSTTQPNNVCQYSPGTPGGTGQAPSALFYNINPWTVRIDMLVQPQGPSVSNCNSANTDTRCTYALVGSTPLPSGLGLNTNSGVISGSPSTVQSRTVTIRASNSYGSTTTSLTVNVVYPAPSGLTINNIAPSKLYRVGQTMQNIDISYSSTIGSVTSMTLDKPLPAGLSLDLVDSMNKIWKIRGNPSASKPIETYTLTACGPTSPCSSLTFDLGTAVAPTSLSFNINGNPLCTMDGSIPACTFAIKQIFNDIPAVYDGDSIQFEIVSGGEGQIPVNELPSGIGLKSTDGSIYTTTYGPFEGTSCAFGGNGFCLYTIRAFNALGSASAQIKLKVNDKFPPGNLSYNGSPFTFRSLTPITAINPVWEDNKLPDCAGQSGCYTVSPGLPQGIAISPLSGVISGSAFKTALQPPTVYTITANNTSGNGGVRTTQVTIEVKERLPKFDYNLGGVFIFGKNNSVASGGVPVITQVEADHCGDEAIPIESFTISPALPAGLSINAGSFVCGVSPETNGGAITGSPAVLSSEKQYTITGCNTGGCTQKVVTLAVAPLVRKVVSGERHACAIVKEDLVGQNNERVMCWGANDQSQLGYVSSESCIDPDLGSVNCSKKAKYVTLGGSPITGAIDLVAGKNHTCVILDNTPPDADETTPDNFGIPYCWGDNSEGQLGNGALGVDSLSPVRVRRAASTNNNALFSFASSIGAGGNSTCLAAEVYSTSLDEQQIYGQVFCSSPSTGLVEKKIDPSETLSGEQLLIAEKVSLGEDFSCIIHQKIDMVTEEGETAPDIVDSRGIKCWGSNDRGQLGDNLVSGGSSANPVFVTYGGGPVTNASQITTGAQHACYATETVTRCWGDNSYNQLGINTADGFRSQPVNVVSKTGSGTLGATTSIGATANASFFGFGNGGSQLLTAGQYVLSGTPYVGEEALSPTNILLSAGVNLVAIDEIAPQGPSSLDFTCGAGNVTGTVYCWGKNHDGQLGNDTTTDSVLPVKVKLEY